MSGLGEAPAIAGRGFMVTFGAKSAKDLFDTIKAEMPFGTPGSLPDQTYTNLVAFILHANGAATGSTALTPTTATRISSVANAWHGFAADVSAGLKPLQTAQAAPAAAAAAPAGGAPGADGGGNGNAGAAARLGLPARKARAVGFRSNTATFGVVKEGNIANYQNVTDEMLTNPSPNDWLMYRGNYSGWSYSALNQITPANVNQLQLKWMLAMNDGGTNETTPIVHNGVIFLLSSGNTVQAINAVTGEVIWQNNIGPAPRNLEPGGSSDETRSIALYNDKVIVPTPQGRIYGLDAKDRQDRLAKLDFRSRQAGRRPACQYRRRDRGAWQGHCRHGQLRAHSPEGALLYQRL